jgi:hypothetical protein
MWEDDRANPAHRIGPVLLALSLKSGVAGRSREENTLATAEQVLGERIAT